MFSKRILLASSALAVLASVTQAHAGDYYVSVFGGANWQANDKSGFQSGPSSTVTFGTTAYRLSSDTGFAIGGAVGLHLDQWLHGLRAEVEASYRRNKLKGNWAVTTFFTHAAGDINGHDSTFALMANVWYDVNVSQKWTAYLGGGAGWARRNINGALATTFTTNSSNTTHYGHGFNVHESGFAWQVGAGVNYEIQDGVHLGVGYRYFRGPDVRNDIFLGKHDLPVNFDQDNHTVQLELSVDIN